MLNRADESLTDEGSEIDTGFVAPHPKSGDLLRSHFLVPESGFHPLPCCIMKQNKWPRATFSKIGSLCLYAGSL